VLRRVPTSARAAAGRARQRQHDPALPPPAGGGQAASLLHLPYRSHRLVPERTQAWEV